MTTPPPEPNDAQLDTMAAMTRRCTGPGRPHPNGGWVHGGGTSVVAPYVGDAIYFGVTGDAGRERAIIDVDGVPSWPPEKGPDE